MNQSTCHHSKKYLIDMEPVHNKIPFTGNRCIVLDRQLNDAWFTVNWCRAEVEVRDSTSVNHKFSSVTDRKKKFSNITFLNPAAFSK